MILSLTLSLLLFQDTELEGCRRCDHRGVTDCKRHDDEVRELARSIEFSTALAQCKDCHGALVVACKRCDGGPETAAMLEKAQSNANWMATRSKVEKHLDRDLRETQTRHYFLIVDVPFLRNGKKKVDSDLYMLRLAADLERGARMVNQHFDRVPEDYKTRMRLWMWGEKKAHADAMQTFLFSTSAGDFKMLGRDPVFSVWTADPTFGSSAPGLHALLVHNSIHMLLSNLYNEVWVGDIGGGWLDAGAAHWYEAQIMGLSVNYCIDEATVPPNYMDGVWRPAIRKKLAKEESRILPGLIRKHTGQLEEEEHALTWSVYDWIVQTKPEALYPILEGIKKRQNLRTLFETHLGLDLFEAEDHWRTFVDESYPAKEKRPRR